MFLDPRNGPSHDLPPPVSGRRTYVIATLPRTGSTLLCRLLTSTGCVGDPKEYLNPMQVRDWQLRFGDTPWTRLRHRALVGRLVPLAGRWRWSPDRLARHLDTIRARRSSPDGWFGLKIHAHHFDAWFTQTGWSVDALLGEATWVFLTRSDRVAQAVSWHRALISGRWSAEQRASLPPLYDRRLIQRRLDAIRDGEQRWERWFANRRITPLRLEYESVIRSPAAAVAAVLVHLGVPAAPLQLDALPMTRQADALSESWIQRFREGR